jgi:Ca2+/Na+ antiporter
MAIGVCFGAPLLTDLIGLGLSITVATADQYPAPLAFQWQNQNVVSWGFLFLSLGSSLVAFPYCNYLPGVNYGIYLICLYAVFLLTSVFLEIYK